MADGAALQVVELLFSLLQWCCNLSNACGGIAQIEDESIVASTSVGVEGVALGIAVHTGLLASVLVDKGNGLTGFGVEAEGVGTAGGQLQAELHSAVSKGSLVNGISYPILMRIEMGGASIETEELAGITSRLVVEGSSRIDDEAGTV